MEALRCAFLGAGLIIEERTNEVWQNVRVHYSVAIRTRLYRTDRFTVLALLCAVTEAVHPSIAPTYVTA